MLITSLSKFFFLFLRISLLDLQRVLLFKPQQHCCAVVQMHWQTYTLCWEESQLEMMAGLVSLSTWICVWLKLRVKKKTKPSRGFWTITALLLKSFCNASAWLISLPLCTEDWLKQKLTASMIQGDFLLQSGPTMCNEFLMNGSGGVGVFLWGEEVRVEYWYEHPEPPH